MFYVVYLTFEFRVVYSNDRRRSLLEVPLGTREQSVHAPLQPEIGSGQQRRREPPRHSGRKSQFQSLEEGPRRGQNVCAGASTPSGDGADGEQR